MATPVTIEEYEEEARKKLPDYVWDYYHSGASNLLMRTAVANIQAYSRYYIRPHVLRDVSDINITTTLLGHKVSAPLGVCPSAHHIGAHPEAEIATARGCNKMKVPFTLSVFADKSIEEVAEGCSEGLKWMQLQPMRNRSLTIDIVQRAEKCGFKAIVVTCDHPVNPSRHGPQRVDATYMKIANFNEEINKKHQEDYVKLLNEELLDPSATWEWVDWLHSITTLPIVLKGIQRADDAREAINHNIWAIQVSNHGGRKLDGGPPTIDVLSEIVEAVDGKVEVYVDGGIRHGTDVFKALALGARAVFLGRPIIWGLACGGEDGVYNILNIVKEEFRQTMALSGCPKLSDITKDMVIKIIDIDSN